MTDKLDRPPLPSVEWYPLETVSDFQRRHGLTVDGIAGRKTWDVIRDLEWRASTRPDSASPGAYSYGGAEIRKGVCRDPHRLLSPFADRVERIFREMRQAGFDPLCWETWRSPERAHQLAARGTGIVDSMHCYGAAVDIVDSDETHWTAPPGFWQCLRETALSVGCYVLHDAKGRDVDLPHVQAVAVKDQSAFRAMSPQSRTQAVT